MTRIQTPVPARATPRTAAQKNLNHLAYREGWRAFNRSEEDTMTPALAAVFDRLEKEDDRVELHAAFIDGYYDNANHRTQLTEEELDTFMDGLYAP